MIDTLQYSLAARRRSWITPMTITIGFACKDAIIFASDSRMTVHDSEATIDAEKITEINFSDGVALLAKSGDKEIGDAFEVIFSEAAKDKYLADAQTVATESLDNYRSKVSQASYLHNMEVKERERFHRIRKTDFLVGFYQEKPCLIRASLELALFSPVKPTFFAFGQCQILANYLAREIDLGTLSVTDAKGVAAYFVASCIEHSAASKGPLQMGVITREKTSLVEKDFAAELYQFAKRTDAELRKLLTHFLKTQYFIQSGGLGMLDETAFDLPDDPYKPSV